MIYFIQEGDSGPIKIGKAKSVNNRIKTLQTAQHKDLIVLEIIPGGIERETKIKRDLKKFRIRGEWYQSVPEVLEYIKSVRNIEYEVISGKAYAVIYRASEKEEKEICPFCGKRHIHGIGDGHRIAHCSEGSQTITAADGTILTQDHGYILRTKNSY